MAKNDGVSQATNAGWTSTQAYVFALICLLVGLAAGYLLRGSGAAPAVGTSAEAGAGTPAMAAGMGQPTPEQMKRMADKQAEPLLERLKNEPNNADLLANIGNIYYDTQQYQAAIDYYTRSLKANPANANVRTDMGTAFYYMGDADRALKEFQTTLTYDPKHGQTMFNMGMVQWQGKGDAKSAVESWEKLLQEVPNYPERSQVEELIARAKQHSNIAPGTKTNKPATM